MTRASPALLALTALLAAAPAAPAQRVRLGTLAPQGSSYHRILQEMGEKWKAATTGGVQLVVYAGGTMGNEAELVRRMRLGQLQAATITITGLREIDPAVTALQEIPMMFRSLEEVAYVRERFEPTLERLLAAKGFVVLFWADAGWVRYFSREAALHPDDFKSMKTFVTAGDIEHFDLLKAAGHNPVALDWNDAYTSLQPGVGDRLLHGEEGESRPVAHEAHLALVDMLGDVDVGAPVHLAAKAVLGVVRREGDARLSRLQ
jgi:TRAP-type C4-dicarboxylate transport system substrate-binding protein